MDSVTNKKNGINNFSRSGNMNYNLVSVQVGKYGLTHANKYGLNRMFSADITNSHNKGELHIHDLDYSPFYPIFNCMTVDFETMLNDGFHIGSMFHAHPTSLREAIVMTCRIIGQVSRFIYGGMTLSRVDEVLSPYLLRSYKIHLSNALLKSNNKDQAKTDALDKCREECLQSFMYMQEELHTMHESSSNPLFVTLGFGLGTTPTAQLIQKGILEARINGIGKNSVTPLYPKLIFALKNGINLTSTDKNYHIKELALKCASRRIYPDVISYEGTKKLFGHFQFPMGCRNFLGNVDSVGAMRAEGRNSLGVVTINLPRIAIESKHSEEAFFELLDQRLELVHEALAIKANRFKDVMSDVAPILYQEGACGFKLNKGENVYKLFTSKRATVSLGYIGLSETIQSLYGLSSTPDKPEAYQKGLAVLRYINSIVERWNSEEDIQTTVYASPAEGICSRFLELDRSEFGTIDGVTDKDYYTNSFHLDVRYEYNSYEKIEYESHFIKHSKGGFISYVELSSIRNNIEALENIWDYAYERLPYFGCNVMVDNCFLCGFEGEFSFDSKGYSCPHCGNSNETKFCVTRRVCGYLGKPAIRSLNSGKQSEVQERVKHHTSG